MSRLYDGALGLRVGAAPGPVRTRDGRSRRAAGAGSCAVQIPASPAAAATPALSLASPPGDDLDKLTNEQLVVKLLVITGAGALGKQIVDSMAESMKKTPGIPPGFLQRFAANAHADDLVELIIPIYVRNYDAATMKAAIRFYQSEQGRILISKLPTVTKESSEAGREWGRKLAIRTLSEMGATPSAGTKAP